MDEVDDLNKNLIGIFEWGAALVAAVIIGWIVIRAVRRRVANPPAEVTGFGFSLKQIEAMYERGELTAEEYKALKRRKAEQAARTAEKYLAGQGRKGPNFPEK
ncbi:MAG: hypothetical protein ACP5QA_02790 [Phycisphaerae bacterium]